MNAARALVLIVVAVASAVVYLLMRRPEMRRPQFQGGQGSVARGHGRVLVSSFHRRRATPRSRGAVRRVFV